MARNKFWAEERNVSFHTRFGLYESRVPIMLYGCKTWSLLTDTLPKMDLQGYIKGGWCHDKQEKSWLTNVKEWTSCPMRDLLKQAQDRSWWHELYLGCVTLSSRWQMMSSTWWLSPVPVKGLEELVRGSRDGFYFSAETIQWPVIISMSIFCLFTFFGFIKLKVFFVLSFIWFILMTCSFILYASSRVWEGLASKGSFHQYGHKHSFCLK